MSVRPARLDDLDDLYALHVAVIAAGRGVVRDVPWPREHEADRLTRYLSGDRSGRHGALLVAESDGRVVGQVDVQRLGPPFLRHVALLGIEVHPAHQGRGHGRALMEGAMGWCRDHAVHRLELYVRADNDVACALYRSLEFVEEGRRRRFVRLPDGTFVDDLVMARLL